jgi:hypothetical protein
VTVGRITLVRDGRRWFSSRLLLGISLVALVVVAGWLEVRFGLRSVVGALAAAGAIVLVWQRAFGVMLGIAVLVNLNGIPGLDVNPGGVAISRLQDLSAVGLLVGSLYVVASGKVAQRSTLQRMLYVVSLLLAAWWLVTWARTAAFHGVPPTLAAKFARDFLYFALTLPLLCDVFVTYPRLRRQVLWTLGAGAAVYALAQLALSGAHVSLGFILHPQLSTVVLGTTRTYSSMNMLVRAAFALSCGALLLAPTRRLRWWAAAAAVLFGAAMLLQLTRAAYFGAAVGILVAGFIWWFRRGSTRYVARRQLIIVPLLALCCLGLGATVSSGERQLISKFATRAVAGYTDVSTTGGTVEVRVSVANAMLGVLGQNWPIGVGFMHPAVHYYPTLPQGDIRDPDLGVLNAVMLMGAVGAILVYLPLLLVLRSLVRASPLPGSTVDGDEWFRLGSSIWIIAVLASSITLVELFSFGGLELSACLLAMAGSVAVSRGPRPRTGEERGGGPT